MINKNMVNQDNNEIKKTAKEVLSDIEEGQRLNYFTEKKEYVEKEITPEEKMIKDEIKRELDLINQDDNLKKESENKAKKIQYLGDEEKLKNLLDLAKNKGVAFAVKTASNMNDPFILDTFHDLLVKEGLWKNFKQ